MNRTLTLESACVRHCLTVDCQQQSLANVATCRSTFHHRWSMYLHAQYGLHNVSHFTCSSASQYAVFTQNSTFKLTTCTTIDSSINTIPQLWTASHQINRRLCTTYCSLTQIVCWSVLATCTGLWVQKLTISRLVFRRLHFGSLLPDPLSGLVLPRPTGQPLNDDTRR